MICDSKHVHPLISNPSIDSVPSVVSESLQGIENIYDDMELHSTPLKTDPLTMPNSDTINGLCVIESGQGSVDDDSSIQVMTKFGRTIFIFATLQNSFFHGNDFLPAPWSIVPLL